MKFFFRVVLAVQGLAVLARPAQNMAARAEGEKKDANKVDQAGKFGIKINLGGGNIQTDTLFPPGKNGALEVEFQNTDARVLTVTENKTPAAAPAGFAALEPVSWVVALEGGAANLTLQKVDYIRNANNTLDISKGVLGRLCPETRTFVVGAGVGETEFEADENELTTPVGNMVGEFAMFLPVAAATPGGGGGAAGGAGGAATGAGDVTMAELLAQLLGLLGVTGKAGGKKN